MSGRASGVRRHLNSLVLGPLPSQHRIHHRMHARAGRAEEGEFGILQDPFGLDGFILSLLHGQRFTSRLPLFDIMSGEFCVYVVTAATHTRQLPAINT